MKKVFFALFAVVIAVGGSAFTGARVVGDIYGSTSTNYSKANTSDYQSTDCTPVGSRVCAYRVTEAGKDIVTASSYTNLEMADLLTSQYVEQIPSSGNGLYLFE